MRDLMQNYIQEHPNASEAEKLAYAGVVAKLLNAREHAKKAPMIRSLIKQREQELRQMETRPEQSAVNESATDASRMAESALQSVIRKVRVARENAQDTPGALWEAKRSIECDDEDYVSVLEGEIKRQCKENQIEVAARLRFAYIRQQQTAFDLNNEKELLERFNPAVHNAFTRQVIAEKSKQLYRRGDPTLSGMDELFASEGYAYERTQQERQRRSEAAQAQHPHGAAQAGSAEEPAEKAGIGRQMGGA